jgi:SAM-dependent methyltransferase
VSGTPDCPACGSVRLVRFHEVDQVPVSSCLLVQDHAEALAFGRGQLRLERCEDCGFITNTAFEPWRTAYNPDYEETQAFSPHFQGFIRDLSRDWVDRFCLRGKHIVEIGCGKGEFLVEMLRAGAASGLGIDPGVHPERVPDDIRDRARWIRGFFPSDLPELVADAVVCRHTLEHIAPVGEFMQSVRRAIGERRGTAVLFELPGTQHVLDNGWFWDIYYEHCSYFTAGSLARLMRRTGFELLGVRPAYDGQYLLVEALPSDTPAPGAPLAIEDDLDRVAAAADHFAAGYEPLVESWRRRVVDVTRHGGTAVIWGSGSKGVAFLAALGDHADAIEAAVDVNPFKHGRFMAGTGHEIISPKSLVDVRPDLVIAMNATYLPEIRADLASLGVDCTLVAL